MAPCHRDDQRDQRWICAENFAYRMGLDRGCLCLVWMAEALNTAIEFLADEVSQEWRARIGQAKDVAAFGVLVSALAAATIGLLVFVPHLT